MAKNIVICCDGTGNQFGDHNSNVVKLYAVLPRESGKQVLYYHPGVGTKGSMDVPTIYGRITQRITKMHGFAYGYGVIDNVAHAYRYLMDTYEPGDKLFLIGFSRGSYTVRVLSSMLYEFGLLEKGNRVLIEYALSLFLDSTVLNRKIARNFKATFGRDCSPHFVGVWDTVSSVGWLYDPLHLAFTKENPGINIGRQAVAIDERRVYFRTNLWQEATPEQDLKQVWFAGVHGDIGGGYPNVESQLSQIPLEWMMKEAYQAGLLIDQTAAAKLLTETKPDPNGEMHRSLHGLWWIPEFIPKSYEIRIGDKYKSRIGVYGGRPRLIPEGSVIHESVLERMKNPANGYKPRNLPARYSVEPWK
jgi:uncharacterized protein (DUF2235 family)